MKAMVTGGAGFIGSHLVDALIAHGDDVAVVDNLSTGKRENLNSQARFYEVDLCTSYLREAMANERPEVVFHQAAQASVKVSTDDPIFDAQVNVQGLLNVLEASVATGVRKVVFASSGATSGNPDYLPIDEKHPQRPGSPYGISKMVAEHYLRYYATDHGLQFTALRYGNVYGPRQDPYGEAGVVAIFTNQLLSGQVPTIHWDGEQVRDYVYVEDIASANLQAAQRGDGGCFSIGTGIGTSVNEIYREICDSLACAVIPQRGPRRAGDLRAACFDIRLAKSELDWAPTVLLAAGIARTCAYSQQQLLRSSGRMASMRMGKD
jgi:UDP-glucose 4-epimerase